MVSADPMAQSEWTKRLGNITPAVKPTVAAGRAEQVPGGNLARFVLEVEFRV